MIQPGKTNFNMISFKFKDTFYSKGIKTKDKRMSHSYIQKD